MWKKAMNERKRILWLLFIMAAASLTVAGIAVSLLYRAAFEEERARLVETAQSQARLIEAVARFDATYSKDYPEGPEKATLSQIADAHKRYKGFGDTGEFTLAKNEGEHIAFLLSHRHYDLHNPKPVLFDSPLAEPMRRALSGLSGTVVGLDYRGEEVLAAYEPVGELNLGIVAKIDLAEVRRPFVRAGMIAGGMALIVVLAGAALFLRISNPIIRGLEERSADLSMVNEQLKQKMGEHRKAEEALRIERDNFFNILNSMEDGVYIVNENYEIEFVNRGLTEEFGPLRGSKCYEYFHDKQEICPWCKNKEVLAGGTVRWEWYSPKNQKTYDLIDTPLTNADGSMSKLELFRDITQHKRAEQKLKRSLKEKEILLREIHHRVKNNLQIVASLLHMSIMQTDNQEAKGLLRDAHAKVHTMALIHRHLYQEPQFDQIDMAIYTRRLVDELSRAYRDEAKSIHTLVEPSDVYLTLDQAIPCGLVINELISNAFKHAFKGKTRGTINISIRGADNDMIGISVKDDGVGIPDDAQIHKPKALGLELVDALVKQLRGTLQFIHSNGTEVAIQFKAIKEEAHA